MRAAVHDRYGPPDVRRIELPVPSSAAGQVLVEIAATRGNLSDRECLTGSPFHGRLGGLLSSAPLPRPRQPLALGRRTVGPCCACWPSAGTPAG